MHREAARPMCMRQHIHRAKRLQVIRPEAFDTDNLPCTTRSALVQPLLPREGLPP